MHSKSARIKIALIKIKLASVGCELHRYQVFYYESFVLATYIYGKTKAHMYSYQYMNTDMLNTIALCCIILKNSSCIHIHTEPLKDLNASLINMNWNVTNQSSKIFVLSHNFATEDDIKCKIIICIQVQNLTKVDFKQLPFAANSHLFKLVHFTI